MPRSVVLWGLVQTFLPWIVIAGILIFLFRPQGGGQQRERQGADFLTPSGDPTRHILASLVLKGSIFRNALLKQFRNPFVAHAAEPALDMPLILAAARRIEANARPAQWAVVIGLLLVVFLIPVKAKLLFLLIWIGFCVFLQYRDRFVLAADFQVANYDPAKLRTKYPAEVEVPAAGAPVLVSGLFNPFVGLGLNLGGWNIALDVSRPAEGKERVKPLPASQIEQSLTDAIAGLAIPNLTFVDRLLVSGVEAARTPDVQPDRFQPPAREVSPQVLQAFREHPDDRARVYRFATITSFGGEVILSYAFRVLKRGSSLGIEVVHLAAPPLAPQYRSIDHLRVVGPWTGFLWFVGAVIKSPVMFFAAFISIFAQIAEIWDEALGGVAARERREIERNPAYNYGARWSLRTHTASPNYNSWFQKADVQQYLRGLEEQVLNALRDCLEAHDVDISAFTTQSMSVHNNNVQITSQRDVNLQGVAFGQGAKAISMMGRLGLQSKNSKAA